MSALKPIEGYVVRWPNGGRSLHLDRAVAEKYAAQVRGTWAPLVEATRRSDLEVEAATAPSTPHQPKGPAP